MNLPINLRKARTALTILFLACYLIPLTGFSQKGESLLWKVQGDGISDSYLFGTFHILPQEDFELKDKVKNALEEMDQLAMELDMSNPNLQMDLMRHATMKNGGTLDKLFEDDIYKKLDAMLKSSVGIGMTQLNSMKPFMISSLLINRYVGAQPASFESVLATLAAEQKMKMIGLETPEQQMDIFDKIPYQDQADDIVEMIEDEDEVKKMFAKMIELYKEEKMSKLYDLSAKYFDKPGALKALLLDRNKSWIPLFAETAKETSTFFAVGAGHLGGKEGLVNLLQKNGYTLTPIN